MIESRQDLVRYLEADKAVAATQARRSLDRLVRYVFYPDYVCRYISLLRRVEYYQNCARTPAGKLWGAFLRIRLHKLGHKLGFSIGTNSIGPGLSLPHVGMLVIHEEAQIGANFTINVGSVIGADSSGRTPRIGNGVTVEAGAKIFGDIELADDIVVGANAVVNRSFLEPDIAIAGVPARKIGEGAGTRRREALDRTRAARQ